VSAQLDLEPVKSRKRKPALAVVYPPPAHDLRWLTVDPGTGKHPLGLAWHAGTALVCAGSLVEAGPSLWALTWHEPWDPAPGRMTFESDWLALRWCLRTCPALSHEAGTFQAQAVILERPMGFGSKTIAEYSDVIGYVRGLAHEAGCEHVLTSMQQSWKAAAGRATGTQWPAKSATAKVHSVDLLRMRHGIIAGDDVADAVWLGEAAVVLGLLPGQRA
jgi:hypothetical protein